MEDNFYPSMYSRVIVRGESFGGYLRAPYGNGIVELSTIEFNVARLCNGQHNVADIVRHITALNKRQSHTAEEAAWNALKRFHELSLLEWLFEPTHDVQFSEVRQFTLKDKAILGRALSAPLSVLWDITYACNLHCPHCLTNSGKPAIDELNHEEAMGVIAQLSEMKVFSITICGGEPLVCPYLFDVIEHAKSKGIEVYLDTNGLLVDMEMASKLVASGVSLVQISIDGREGTHDRFRQRNGSFAAAVRAVKMFTDLGLEVSVSSVLTAITDQDLEYVVNLAADLGASSFKASLFLPTGRGRMNNKTLMLPSEKIQADYKKLLLLRKQLGDRLHIALEGTYPGLEEESVVTASHELLNSTPVGCSAGVSQLVIAANGDVCACPFLYDLTAGNIRKDSLSQIWREADVFHHLRDMTIAQLKGKCHSCTNIPEKCAGGCRAAAFVIMGDLYGEDPICWYRAKKQPSYSH